MFLLEIIMIKIFFHLMKLIKKHISEMAAQKENFFFCKNLIRRFKGLLRKGDSEHLSLRTVRLQYQIRQRNIEGFKQNILSIPF